MKKLITLLCLLCIVAVSANAQYYYVPHAHAGQNPGNLNQDPEYPVGGGISPGWNTLLAGPNATPVWSANTTLPFTFNFNGTDYNTFKVSASGVLTFDTAATTVPAYARATIPNATIPDNSILIWGIEATGTNDDIVVKTFGTAPNRQYWVVFSSFTAVTGCSIYWGIVLEETTNKIYIADMRNLGCAVSLTAGIQINSTTALKIYTSPSLAQLAGTDPTTSDNSYYEFIQGSLPASNAYLSALTNVRYALLPANINITGRITNFGANPITSITIKYLALGDTFTYVKTGLNVASYASYSFTHNIPFNVATAGSNQIKVWVELPGDVDQTNDTLNTLISGLSFLPLKNIVFEEGTGTWCGWCPRGAVFMDSLENIHPDRAMLIAVHNADVMSNPEYDAAMSLLVSGYPSGLVDRKVNDVDPSTFITQYNNRIIAVVPCEVGVLSSYNLIDSILTVEVSGHFAGDLEGDYRFNAAITEDGVTGPGDGTSADNLDYDQTNYYSFQINNEPLVGAGHNWQLEPDPVLATNMVFDHVARGILGTFKGVPGSLPSFITGGNTYTYTFSYQVPAGFNVNNMHAIGWISDASTGEILNSNREVNILGISSIPQQAHHLIIYPNPSSGIFNIKSGFTGNMKVKVMNSLGETVASYEKMNFTTMQTIDLSKQSNGLYFIQFTDENNVVSLNKVMINR